jgi:hypothetical protein
MRKFLLLVFGFFASLPTLSQPLSCTSFQGIAVPYIANAALPDVGVAHRTMNGRPVIQVNPMVLAGLPEVVRQFWYAHECAHHALHPALNSEVNADCWAVKTLRNIGVVRGAWDVQALLTGVGDLPGNMMTGHLPGPARAQNLYYCVNTP